MNSIYRMALRVLIGAVGISAILGMYALLRQEFDDLSGKTLGTTLIVSAASLLIMANAAVLEKRSMGYLLISATGVLAALGALPVSLYAIWFAAGDDGAWRSGASLGIISVFAGHSSLLSLRQLSAQYRWLKPIATVLGGTLAVLVIGMVWADELESAGLRAAGVLSILLLSVTIFIPVLSRLVALDDPETAGGKPGRQRSDGVRYCPSCGRSVRASGEKGRCKECGAGFAVQFGARR